MPLTLLWPFRPNDATSCLQLNSYQLRAVNASFCRRRTFGSRVLQTHVDGIGHKQQRCSLPIAAAQMRRRRCSAQA